MRQLLLLTCLLWIAAPLRGVGRLPDDDPAAYNNPPREKITRAIAKYPERDRAYYARRWVEDYDETSRVLFDFDQHRVRADRKYGPGSKEGIHWWNKRVELVKYRQKMLDNDPLYLPILKPDDWRVGRTGRLGDVKIQSIDSDGAITVLLVDESSRTRRRVKTTGDRCVIQNPPSQDSLKRGDVISLRGQHLTIVNMTDEGVATMKCDHTAGSYWLGPNFR